MKRRAISLLLSLCILISMVPVTAIRAHAASTWYAPVVRQVMDEYGYKWLNDYDKPYCRGALQDIDGDGFEELVLVFYENGSGNYAHCQVWDLVDGAIAPVIDQKYYFIYGGLAAFSLQLDGKNYLAIEVSNTGTVGTNYYWELYDPQRGYEKALVVHYDYSDFLIGGTAASSQQAVQLTMGLKNTAPLAGHSYFHTEPAGRTFEDLSSAEIYTQLVAYTQDQDMSILEGGEMAIRYVLYESNEIVTDWAKPAVAFSDGNVAQAVSWEQEPDGYVLKVKGLNPGETTLTVTDADSKAFVSVTFTVRDTDAEPCTYPIYEVPTGYLDRIGDRKTQTNFYGFNGLSVNQYKCGSKENGYFPISFTVYNSSSMYGSVDIYDKNGKWIGCERIQKFQDPTSLYEVGENTWFLIKDLVTLNSLSYTADTVSQKTDISIRVPEGGYITISNNYQESPGTYLYNSVDLLMNSANAVLSLVMGVTQVEQVQDQIIHMMMENEAFTKAFIDEFTKIAQDTIQEMTYDGIAGNVGALTAHANEFFEALQIDFWSVVSSVCGIAENVFLQCTMAEVSIAMKSMFAVNKGINTLCQVSDISTSGDEPGILLTSALAYSETVTVSGIKATPENSSVLPSNAVLKVFRIADRSTLTIPALGMDTENFLLYNICYTVRNQEVQPNGSVTVQIPVPDHFDASRCVILHQKDNGSWEQIPSHLENGFLVFKADHFSLFAIAESDVRNSFSDVALGSWYTDSVLWAVANGITNGRTATTFAPDANCKRSEIVTFLWRTVDQPAPASDKIPFTDVNKEEFYTDAVAWAVEKNITNGMGGGIFGTELGCTRAQVVTFLWRTAGCPKPSTTRCEFPDVIPGEFYFDAVLWAVEKGITNGMDDGTFGVGKTCTRSQIVTFLHRFAG